ncbi:phage terminase large subunit family protein [Glutamicibacter sp. AOP12-B1-11]|uniref:phage terminase large subunit family protein n=1 Tax=Glutamicibacter sp. AOP12-B1-11 TaxID=3457725 RepID=UPI00403362E0
MWIEQADGSCHVLGIELADHELIQSWDLAFKGENTSDYFVGQAWLRVGNSAYLLDQVRWRMKFNKFWKEIKAMTAKWPETKAKLVEDRVNGPTVMSTHKATVVGRL